MKTKKEGISARSAYKRHTAQFKGQALELGDRDGIAKVPQDLGVAFLGLWVKKAAGDSMGAGGRAPTVGALSDAGAVAEKYAMIKPNEDQFRIGLMCRLLLVSRSGQEIQGHHQQQAFLAGCAQPN